jgi:hypothetical protein
MEPREDHPTNENYSKREPDLILYFEKWSFDLNYDTIIDLRRGDMIRFNATGYSLGSRSVNHINSKY